MFLLSFFYAVITGTMHSLTMLAYLFNLCVNLCVAYVCMSTCCIEYICVTGFTTTVYSDDVVRLMKLLYCNINAHVMIA